VLGVVARRTALLESIRDAAPGRVEAYGCDVRDLGAMKAAAAHFVSTHGPPDVVIGNAGVSYGTLAELEADAAVFRETLETNVMGLVHTFQPFIAPLRERGRGSLVGIASVAGFRGLPGAGAYSASKAAAIRYLESLRVELHGTGVTVTTICPGYIATPMTARNPYRMPFILDADEAARRFARAIAAKKRYTVIPWQMAIVGRLLGLLPDALFDRLASRSGRKPRKPA
jgi:NAD(P)-dependent dehydrogenase (short-subunit alcohol dehydrogenase family)